MNTKSKLFRIGLLLAFPIGVYAAPCECQKACQGCASGKSEGGGGCMIADAVPSDAAKPAAITKAQREELLLLHEEERLARDVYQALGKKYPLNPFLNIPHSEQNHMQATAELLTYHGIPVPEEGAPGVYGSKVLNKLYKRFMKRGSKSEIDALSVGALVEETDIRDLREMAAAPPSAVAKSLSEQLESASYNHLRAFVRNLSARGVDYEPKILSATDFSEIVGETSSPGRGKGAGQGRGAGRGQGRGFRGGR
jgi:hypothetical protein